MRRITLITGGCRSGKSSFGLVLAKSKPGTRLFLATCPVLDREMAIRIQAHQTQRKMQGWKTVEEEVSLGAVISRHGDFSVILIDCLTLWINNLIYREGSQLIRETDVDDLCTAIIECCHKQTGDLILIINEVGMGIVPENPLARRYRDLIGRCQQSFASHAESVILMVAGLSLWVKGEPKK